MALAVEARLSVLPQEFRAKITPFPRGQTRAEPILYHCAAPGSPDQRYIPLINGGRSESFITGNATVENTQKNFVFDTQPTSRESALTGGLLVQPGQLLYIGQEGHVQATHILDADTYLQKAPEEANPFSHTEVYMEGYGPAKDGKGFFHEKGWTGQETRGVVRKEYFDDGRIGTTLLEGLQLQAAIKDFNSIKDREANERRRLASGNERIIFIQGQEFTESMAAD